MRPRRTVVPHTFAAVASLLLFVIPLRAQSVLRPPSQASRPPQYDGDVRLDPARRTVDGRWSLLLSAHRADSVVMLFNAGMRDVRVTGPDVVRADIDTSRGLRRVRVALRPTAGSRNVRLVIRARGVLEIESDGINTVKADYIELGLDSFWFPVLEEFPDVTGALRLTLPSNLRIVTSANVVTRGQPRAGWRTTTFRSTVPLPDFAFVAAPSLTSQSMGRAEAITTTADSTLVRAMLKVTRECAEYLATRYAGERALPVVRIVLPPRSGPGYARQHYVVVPVGDWRGTAEAATARAQRQTNFVCHELAHFWSSGAVATGPENWINEGFAEFVSGRAVRALRGDSAYAAMETQWRARAARAGAVWTASATTRPDANTSYGKAPLLLAALEQRIGTMMMDRLLQQFMTRPLRTTRAVLALVAELAGQDVADWFERQLIA